MRIIENNYNANTEYERDCPRCSSKIAFSFGDLKMDSATLSHYVECPCCGFSIPLKEYARNPTGFRRRVVHIQKKLIVKKLQRLIRFNIQKTSIRLKTLYPQKMMRLING